MTPLDAGASAVAFACALFLVWNVIRSLRLGEVGFSYMNSSLFTPIRRERLPVLFWSAVFAHGVAVVLGFGLAGAFLFGIGLP